MAFLLNYSQVFDIVQLTHINEKEAGRKLEVATPVKSQQRETIFPPKVWLEKDGVTPVKFEVFHPSGSSTKAVVSEVDGRQVWRGIESNLIINPKKTLGYRRIPALED